MKLCPVPSKAVAVTIAVLLLEAWLWRILVWQSYLCMYYGFQIQSLLVICIQHILTAYLSGSDDAYISSVALVVKVSSNR